MSKKLTYEIDNTNGGISYIGIENDLYKMNFVESETATFGVPYHRAQIAFNRFDDLRFFFVEGDKYIYKNSFIDCIVSREYKDGKIIEKYVIKNVTPNPIFFGKGDFCINTPFNDNYESAEYCLTNKCHTHIYTGNKSAYVLALRMGDFGESIGLILIEGKIDEYRQNVPEYAKNDRGDLMLCVAPFELNPGEEYTISWEIFSVENKNSFINFLNKHPTFNNISLPRNVLFKDEIIDNFSSEIGEHIYTDYDGTTAKYYVVDTLSNLISNRINFIINNQQYNKLGSSLDGAYLIYDNDSKSTYFSSFVSDHNACRERIGMGILIANQYKDIYRQSLSRYVDFVLREFVDGQTGDVFDTIGKDSSQIRLYNAPWVCTFFTELYKNFDKNIEYLKIAYRVIKKYYQNGGLSFYPNAFTISETIDALQEAKLHDEANELVNFAIQHAESIISNGINYPKHEVDYEQTIVAPAVTFILEAYKLTNDIKYLEQVKPHLELLDRFNGFAPDYHFDEVAIRHWDDYWFGKSRMFGDTMPHYWSVLSGWCFYLYYKATGDITYKKKAEKSARACLCLFKNDGSASCAYMSAYKVNEKLGQFYDDWANDQDFALYFAIKILGEEFLK